MTTKDDGLIECKICPCRFFSEDDYNDHMNAFGVDGHLGKYRAAHNIYSVNRYGGR